MHKVDFFIYNRYLRVFQFNRCQQSNFKNGIICYFIENREVNDCKHAIL